MADDIIDDIPPSRTGPVTSGPSAARSTTGFDRPGPNRQDVRRPTVATSLPAVVQPTPQALPRRQPGTGSIIVSPRQKGNPVLNNIKSIPWEYGDIPADFILGQTTCALFLQLKYHRLHPEYIYNRIKSIQGKYNLRIVLVMVDIPNHEEALRELSKTSLINNITLILCWSAAEGGRYLELFKTYENAAPTGIRQHQSNAYSDRMVDFITTPRTINKTDAVALVSTFGTIRTAINARHEEVSTIAGWGDKKVQQWCSVVREPFRVQRAAKRSGMTRENTEAETTVSRTGSATPLRELKRLPSAAGDADRRPSSRLAEQVDLDDAFDGDEEAVVEAATAAPLLPATNDVAGKRQKTTDTAEDDPPPAKKKKPQDDPLSDGVMAALQKLREKG